MSLKQSGWRYYLPESDETASDAEHVMVYEWQTIADAEHAAEKAADDEWSNRDGWERGMGRGPDITVIAPDGTETRFSVEREATVEHYVRPVAAT